MIILFVCLCGIEWGTGQSYRLKFGIRVEVVLVSIEHPKKGKVDDLIYEYEFS